MIDYKLCSHVYQISLNLDLDMDHLDTLPGMMEFLYLAQVYQAVR